MASILTQIALAVAGLAIVAGFLGAWGKGWRDGIFPIALITAAAVVIHFALP